MSDQETEWKIEEKSTTPSTGSAGLDEIAASQKELDTAEPLEEDEPSAPRVSGEMRVLLMEDETVIVEFPTLGRWTPGRVEKAMPRIFRECMVQRQRALHREMGLPEVIANTSNEGATDA